MVGKSALARARAPVLFLLFTGRAAPMPEHAWQNRNGVTAGGDFFLLFTGMGINGSVFNILGGAIQTKQSQHSPETGLRYSFDTTEGDAS